MPKDYISTSQKISPWLKAQGITIKVDDLSLVVAEHHDPIPKDHNPADYGGVGCAVHTSDRDGCLHRFVVDLKRNVPAKWGDIVCPYFGPGGADNNLKALRAWVKKQDVEWDFDIMKRGNNVVWIMWKSGTLARTLEGEGKTDGIALHDLLEKLMEECK